MSNERSGPSLFPEPLRSRLSKGRCWGVGAWVTLSVETGQGVGGPGSGGRGKQATFDALCYSADLSLVTKW